MCLTPKITTCGNGIARLDTDRMTATDPLVDYDLTSLANCSYLTMEEYNSLQVNANDLAILQLNIYGPINKQADLNKILMDVNVALLCETWLRTETTHLINIPSFSYVGKERKGKKGRGMGILIDNDLKHRKRPNLEIESEILEHIVIELKCDKDAILIASCYHAPNSDQKQFLNAYSELITKLKSEKKQLIISMDHNLDLLKNTQSFLETNIRHGTLPCISKPTRITHTSATLIDNIFCSESLHTRCLSQILITDLSDHLPCLCAYGDTFLTMNKLPSTWKRSLTERNIQKISSELANINWTAKLGQLVTCNEQFNVLHDTIHNIMNAHAPECLVRKKKEDCKNHGSQKD